MLPLLTHSRLPFLCSASLILLAGAPALSAHAAGVPVQVTVTNTKPIPVDASGGATPVNGICLGFAFSGTTIVRCPLYTVPVGQRLIVENIGWQIAADPANGFHRLIYGLDDSAAQGVINFLPGGQTVFVHHALTSSSGTANFYEGSQLVNVSFQAGQTFSAEYDYATGPNYEQTFTFQGHLVPMP